MVSSQDPLAADQNDPSDERTTKTSRPVSRRDFFLGKLNLAESIQTKHPPNSDQAGLTGRHQASQPHSSSADKPAQPQTGYWEEFISRAMACDFELLFNLRQHPHTTKVAADVFQLLADLEDQLTIYRAHSEVSGINQKATLDWVRVEPGLFELLVMAKDLYIQTYGAFDITAGALTKLWRFDQRAGVLPPASEISRVLENVGSRYLDLDVANQRVRFEIPGLHINLGGIGKGFAVDRAAQLIQSRDIRDFAIHGGQSSVLAMGSDTPAQREPTGWWIGLSHPLIPAFRLGEVRLLNQALGTSGTGRQGFFHRGDRYGHIIDPRTGWPTAHFLSTTVITNSAARSDALATAFFVLELNQVEEFCDSHPDVKAILVAPSERSRGQTNAEHPLLVHTFNFEDSELRFLSLLA